MASELQRRLLDKVLTDEDCAPSLSAIEDSVVTTWEIQSAVSYWGVLLGKALGTQAATCYKSLLCIHWLLYNGHPQALPETYKQADRLRQLYGMWSYSGHPLSPLICAYVTFLTTKIEFHAKHQIFPGNYGNDPAILASQLDTAKACTSAASLMDVQDALGKLVGSVLLSLQMPLSPDQTALRSSPLSLLANESSTILKLVGAVLQRLHTELSLKQLQPLDNAFVTQNRRLQAMYEALGAVKPVQESIVLPPLPLAQPKFLSESGPDKFAGFAPIQDDVVFGSSNEAETELVRLKDYIQLLLEEIKRLQAELDYLTGKLAQRKSLLNEHNRTAARVLQHIKDMEAAIAQQKERINALEAKKASVSHDDCEKIKNSCEGMQAMYHKLLEAHKAAQQQAAGQKAVLEEEATKCHRTTKMLESTKKEVEQLKLEKIRLDKASQALKAKVDTDRADLTSQHQADLSAMEKQYLGDIAQHKASSLAQARQLQESLDALRSQLEEEKSGERVSKKDPDYLHRSALNGSVAASKEILRRALDDFNSGDLGNSGCTLQHLTQSVSSSRETANQMAEAMKIFYKDVTKPPGSKSLTQTPAFASSLAAMLANGKGALQSATASEQSDAVMAACRNAAQKAFDLLDAAEWRSNDDLAAKGGLITAQKSAFDSSLGEIASAMEAWANQEAAETEKLGGELEQQMNLATTAVSSAANRLEELLATALAQQSGTKLDVNEGILARCKALMDWVRSLVVRATDLQREIVGSGLAKANPVDFYFKNQTWAEGLISAARTVGWGANYLVDAADEAVSRSGKVEALIAAANEIMASTAHLVAASRVKADMGSKRLQSLEEASGRVRHATRDLVDSAKAAGESDTQAVDYSVLSDVQAKRAERQVAAKVADLEKELSKVHQSLFAIRKETYAKDVSKGMAADKKEIEVHQ